MTNRVLDTNVILDRPIDEVLKSFDPCIVTIPIIVLKELDKFKTSDNDVLRYHSRTASRFLDNVRKDGDLLNGVIVDSGHTIRIAFGGSEVELPMELNVDCINDYRIIKSAMGIAANNPEDNVILVSQDTNVRVVGAAAGLCTENFGHRDDDTVESLYDGWSNITLTGLEINKIYKGGYYPQDVDLLSKLNENEFVMFTNIENPKNVGTARFDGEKLIPFEPKIKSAMGVKPLNVQQRFYLDLLMDPDIKVVTAFGSAGSGKTLLATAAALEQLYGIGDHEHYKKFVATRSAIGSDHDIGFLPGSEFEKMSAWLASVTDALEFIFSDYEGGAEDQIEDMVTEHKIEYKALTFIRGRSLHNQFVLIEEAQNLTQQTIKLILSRVAKGTKIVIVGDIEQIDNTRLSEKYNGLVYLIDRFKGLPFYGHVNLPTIERSDVAEAAVKLL